MTKLLLTETLSLNSINQPHSILPYLCPQASHHF